MYKFIFTNWKDSSKSFSTYKMKYFCPFVLVSAVFIVTGLHWLAETNSLHCTVLYCTVQYCTLIST